MNIQDIINRHIPPLPWDEGEKIPWHEAEFSERMLKEHLSQRHDAASRRFSIIEQHVGWIERTFLHQKPARVLDLGCGPGLYLERLAQRGHDCVGLDFAPASIRYAKEQARAKQLQIVYKLDDIRSADYGTGYDLVMLINGEFNTFPPHTAKEILINSWHALNEGGMMLLEAHTFEGLQEREDVPATWRSVKQGLFSPQPHLWLQESFWDDGHRTLTTRYLIVDAATAQVTRHAETMQAYTERDYQQALEQAGFQNIRTFPSLQGVEALRQKDMMVVVGYKKGETETATDKDNGPLIPLSPLYEGEDLLRNMKNRRFFI